MADDDEYSRRYMEGEEARTRDLASAREHQGLATTTPEERDIAEQVAPEDEAQSRE